MKNVCSFVLTVCLLSFQLSKPMEKETAREQDIQEDKENIIYLESIEGELVPLSSSYLPPAFAFTVSAYPASLVPIKQPLDTLTLACDILQAKNKDISRLINDYIAGGYLERFKPAPLKKPIRDVLQKVRTLIETLQFLKISQECLARTLKYCLHNEHVQKAITSKLFVYLESKEGTLVSFPLQFLPPDFTRRLPQINLDFIDNDIVIDCNDYPTRTLELAREILIHYIGLISTTYKEAHQQALLNKVEDYLKTDSSNGIIQKAQNLLKLVRFLRVSQDCFNALLQKCAAIIKCDQKELFYSCDAFHKEIAEENLKSCIRPLEEQSSWHPLSLHSPQKQSLSFSVKKLEDLLYIAPQKRRELAFTIALKYEDRNIHLPVQHLIDHKSWQALDVLCGPKSNPESYFAHAIDRTSTEIGKALFYSKLLQPLDAIQELKKRQSIVQELAGNKEIFDKLDGLFKDFFSELKGKNEQMEAKKYENNILAFFTENDPFKELLKLDITNLKGAAKWINSNELMVTLKRGKDIIPDIIINITTKQIKNIIPQQIKQLFDAFMPALASEAGSWAASQAWNSLSTKFFPDPAHLSPRLLQWAASAVSKVPKAHIQQTMMLLVAKFICSLTCSSDEDDFVKGMVEMNFCLQTRLILLAKYITLMKNVYNIVSTSPKLKEYLPFLEALDLGQEHHQDILAHLWYWCNELTHPASFEQFINKLCTATFDEKDDSWAKYHFGRIIATYCLVEVHKERLFEAVMALSELDSYLSVARLYNESQDKPNKYSFVNYDTSETPIIDLKNFWNPCVGYNAVANTLTMGTDNHPKDIIITGPNTGGKSTLMRALIFTILMAQSVGIAPAQPGSHITLFSNIRAYLNITDDASQDASLFKASAQRARELLDAALKTRGLSLTLFDEIYNGTDPKLGESLAYATLKFLNDSARFSHNMCITTTHFPCVQKLRREHTGTALGTNFGYFRVFDIEDPNTLFKIKPGICTKSNAFKVAEDSFKLSEDNNLYSKILEDAKEYYGQNFEEQKGILADPHYLDLLRRSPTALLEMIQLIKSSPNRCKEYQDLLLRMAYLDSFIALIEHKKNILAENNITLATLLNLTNSQGRTVLHNGALDLIEDEALITKLINYGANPQVTDNYGRKPLHYTQKNTLIEELLNRYERPARSKSIKL